MINKLDVFYHDKLVGTIVKKDKCFFQYDEKWITDGFSISPFLLPLKKGLFEAKTELFDGTFGVFSDSLPDAWGRLLLSRYLHKNRPNEKPLSILVSSIDEISKYAVDLLRIVFRIR